MILRTKYGKCFNIEKIWGIEYGLLFTEDTNYWPKGSIIWCSHKVYKSQRRMLQALQHLNENATNQEYNCRYRGVHVDYTYEINHLDEKSLREYKIFILIYEQIQKN